MAFTDQKIVDDDISGPINGKGVQTQPNKLTGSALENKKVFDALVTDVVKAKFNALIDELVAITAAAQIGVDVDGLTAMNLQDAIAEIFMIAQQATTGDITDGSLVTRMYHDGSVTAAKLGSDILPANVGIKYGTEVPTTADISDGEIYFMYTEDE